MGKLANKVAVVTGASKGIGAEIARALAAEGASVVVNYGTSQADADKVVHDITAAGGRAVAIRGNVAKSADVERLLAEAVREFGVIDVLVNNAGVYSFSAIELVFGGGVPPAVRHQCSWRSSGDSGIAQALRPERRQHHQYRFGGQPSRTAAERDLCRDKKRCGRANAGTCEGARTQKYSDQLDQSGCRRDRGNACRWHHRR